MEGDFPKLSSSRWLAIYYYTFFGILAVLITKAGMFALRFHEFLPLLPSLLTALVLSVLIGALLGPSIIETPPPYKLRCFLIGFFSVIVAIPLFDLGILFSFHYYHPSLFETTSDLNRHIAVYVFLLIFSYIPTGILYALVNAYLTIYLRHRFAPQIAENQRLRAKANTEQQLKNQ